MAVKHIFKDGTAADELENVYVPKEIVEQVLLIAERKEKNEGFDLWKRSDG